MAELARSEFILGGQRSGKSRRAEELARQWMAADTAHRAVLIATGQAWDDEMRERIARHRRDRAERVPGLVTVEGNSTNVFSLNLFMRIYLCRICHYSTCALLLAIQRSNKATASSRQTAPHPEPARPTGLIAAPTGTNQPPGPQQNKRYVFFVSHTTYACPGGPYAACQRRVDRLC
mgnify:CR=1 FL=1